MVTGGESAEQRAYGDFLGKAQRYERCGEFLDIVTRLWAGETVDFEGKHLHVQGARLTRRPDPVPDLYFGGSSAEAGPVAARYTDVYLTWGEPPAAVEAKLRWITDLAAPRPMRFGIRLHVISRDTADEAWRQADRLIAGVDEAMIRKVQAGLATSESEGLRRMRDLHGGSRDGLEVSPNLWAGVGLVRGGAGTALVGSHTEVADRIEEYARLGISEFILSGTRTWRRRTGSARGVLPILAARGVWRHPAPEAVDGPLTPPRSPRPRGRPPRPRPDRGHPRICPERGGVPVRIAVVVAQQAVYRFRRPQAGRRRSTGAGTPGPPASARRTGRRSRRRNRSR